MPFLKALQKLATLRTWLFYMQQTDYFNWWFLLPKFRRDIAKNQNSEAIVGLSRCYSRQKLATLLSGFFMFEI